MHGEWRAVSDASTRAFEIGCAVRWACRSVVFAGGVVYFLINPFPATVIYVGLNGTCKSGAGNVGRDNSGGEGS